MAARHTTDSAADSLVENVSNLSIQPSSSARQVRTRYTMVSSIDGLGMIHGLAVYEDQLFVLTCRANKIKVYDATDFSLKREVSLEELKSPQCMDICTRNKLLYISENVSKRVYKLPVSAETTMTSWPVSDKPRGISVNKVFNVLVIIESKRCIEEYTCDGERVRIIPHNEITRPWHCAQLSTRQYVVCHGSEPTDQHRVCLIDQNGSVNGVYGSQPGEEDHQLNWPNYLAVDSRDNIAVCDRKNRRIQLLDSSLTHVQTISQLPDGRRFFELRALCIDDVMGRLYVGQFDGKVHVLNKQQAFKPATRSLNSSAAERNCDS